ncbi:Maintenance of mitochondrial morphology protein 1 [Nakaseomyces bracarensis]|uniref:Maintenance of mitochondrial morphology protein 1 n=1 Tax=Nakaseomyces bracarensis TaxID=273131 RepID=A0ABR4P189_9SACH
MTSNETLISLDEYIKNTLPLQLDEILMEHLQNGRYGNNQMYNSSEHDAMVDETLALTSDLLRSALEKQLLEIPRGVGAPIASVAKPTIINWSFSQGLIIGQISVVLFLVFFVKFFIFTDASHKMENPLPAKVSKRRNSKLETLLSKERRASSVVHDRNSDIIEGSEQLDSILEKTYYNVDTHAPESLDWFNVLIAQMIQQFREEAWQKDNILKSLDGFLKKKSEDIPDYLDNISITEIDIGEDFPIFSNCRIQYVPNSSNRKLEAKIDIDLNDKITLGISTRLLLNYPKPRTAALPIELAVSMVRFQACLTVSLITAEEFAISSDEKSAEEHDKNAYFLVFSFAPDYKIDFDIKSLIGARSKLENIPKISNVIEYTIKKWFAERCVEPRFQFVKLPSMWPRSQNTREEVVISTDDESITSSIHGQ